MYWLDYREKLGIGFSDEDKVVFFLRKMFNILDNTSEELRSQINEDEYFKFCDDTGTSMRQGVLYGEGYKYILSTLKNHCNSLGDFLAYYIAFINCQKDSGNKPYTKDNYKYLLINMLRDSQIPFELFTDEEGIYVFPKGVEEFDAELISMPLQWLCSYPASEKAWAKALRDYADSTPQNASDVADLFRKALESFFKEFFDNDKTLENNKAIYGSYLKEQGIPPEISNNLESLLQAYTNYMNGYAKHHDKTEIKVLEYLMYQTGNIMRLLIMLKQAETA